MDPVFTLQWPEYLLASQLRKLLPKSQGYSVLIPLSRQEKGIDLAVLRKSSEGSSRVVTIQIKASRTYIKDPPLIVNGESYRYDTLFNRFLVPGEADYFLIVGMYAPDTSKTTTIKAEWYKDCTLLFSQKEMKEFMESSRTAKGKEDMFGFGFNDQSKVVQTRGGRGKVVELTGYLLVNRIDKLKQHLNK